MKSQQKGAKWERACSSTERKGTSLQVKNLFQKWLRPCKEVTSSLQTNQNLIELSELVIAIFSPKFWSTFRIFRVNYYKDLRRTVFNIFLIS